MYSFLLTVYSSFETQKIIMEEKKTYDKEYENVFQEKSAEQL